MKMKIKQFAFNVGLCTGGLLDEEIKLYLFKNGFRYDDQAKLVDTLVFLGKIFIDSDD